MYASLPAHSLTHCSCCRDLGCVHPDFLLLRHDPDELGDPSEQQQQHDIESADRHLVLLVAGVCPVGLSNALHMDPSGA